jgi:hypothetical protein
LRDRAAFKPADEGDVPRALGQKVFVRDDAIEGIAPSLTLEIIEI